LFAYGSFSFKLGQERKITDRALATHSVAGQAVTTTGYRRLLPVEYELSIWCGVFLAYVQEITSQLNFAGGKTFILMSGGVALALHASKERETDESEVQPRACNSGYR
jgi:hypothetical protein